MNSFTNGIGRSSEFPKESRQWRLVSWPLSVLYCHCHCYFNNFFARFAFCYPKSVVGIFFDFLSVFLHFHFSWHRCKLDCASDPITNASLVNRQFHYLAMQYFFHDIRQRFLFHWTQHQMDRIKICHTWGRLDVFWVHRTVFWRSFTSFNNK